MYINVKINNARELVEKHNIKKIDMYMNIFNRNDKPIIRVISESGTESEFIPEKLPPGVEQIIEVNFKTSPEFNTSLNEQLSTTANSLEKLADTLHNLRIESPIPTSIKDEPKPVSKIELKPITDPKALQYIEQIRTETLKSINEILKWTMQLVLLAPSEGDDRINVMLYQLENYCLQSKPEQDEQLETIRQQKLDVITNNIKTVSDIFDRTTKQITRFQEWISIQTNPKD
jgi:hypothetical protein